MNPAYACRQFGTEQVRICSLVGQPPDCRKSLVDSACGKSKRLEVQANLRTTIRFRARRGSKKHQLMNCSIANFKFRLEWGEQHLEPFPRNENFLIVFCAVLNSLAGILVDL